LKNKTKYKTSANFCGACLTKRTGNKSQRRITYIASMNSPIRTRNSIPFFYDKSEVDFQKDTYERYDSMVIRQTALHLADEIWEGYPLQSIMDYLELHLPNNEDCNILELGCSTGRMIAEIAIKIPDAHCWGIDYSYQMLKRANEYWVKGDTVYLDFRNQGFPNILELKNTPIINLKFGLAKASDLPFADHSQRFLLNSFLLDRLDDPEKALQEMHRVLEVGGKMLLVTPLNFLQKKHWDKYFPPIKIHQLLMNIGFDILDWEDNILIREPMDLRGNAVEWKCVRVVVQKR